MFRQFFSQAAELKSAREIGLMRESGKIVAEALRLCREMAKPGARTIEIDRAVEALYAKYGATPLFKGYGGTNPKVPFPASTCLSLNEQVVHGIPSNREIRDGDVLKVDTACKLNGWCADAAVSILVGNARPERRRLGLNTAGGLASAWRHADAKPPAANTQTRPRTISASGLFF